MQVSGQIHYQNGFLVKYNSFYKGVWDDVSYKWELLIRILGMCVRM